MLIPSESSRDLKKKQVSFRNSESMNSVRATKSGPRSLAGIPDADMQLIMNLPPVEKEKARKYLKDLPDVILRQSLKIYVKKYKNHRELDTKTTEISQHNICVDDDFKTLTRAEYSHRISVISNRLYSKFVEELLSLVKKSLVENLASKFDPINGPQVIDIIATHVIQKISNSFRLEFGGQIKLNFILLIEPKVNEITKSYNHLS